MKKIFLLVIVSFFLTQCDDGDFDAPTFVFENNINECGESDNLIIYNIGIDDSEALILDVDYNGIDDSELSFEKQFYTTVMIDSTFNLDNKIYYRVFNGEIDNNYFCQDIPPSSPSIVNEWNGSGTLIVNNTIINDDEDGVEELDHDLDTDGDQIPNYLDIDDDNDGILTSNEINDDGSFIDTDSDTIPNYLDDDDDNDGVLTINEALTDENGNDIADYLDDATADIQDARLAIHNRYILKYTATFVIENMSLVNDSGNTINYSNFEYGAKTGSIIIDN